MAASIGGVFKEEIRELERVPATITWTPESPVQAWVRWEQDVS